MRKAEGGRTGGKPAVAYEQEGGGGKGKGVDEFLADAGYNVRPCELREVAHKLHRLEMVLGAAQEEGISHLSSEAVHYNPSDLGGWVESMLHELSNGHQTPTSPVLGRRAGESGSARFVPAGGEGVILGDEFPEPVFLEDYGIGEGILDRMTGFFPPEVDPPFLLHRQGPSSNSSMGIQSGLEIQHQFRPLEFGSEKRAGADLAVGDGPYQNRPLPSCSSASTDEGWRDRKRTRGEPSSSGNDNNTWQKDEEEEGEGADLVLGSNPMIGAAHDPGVRLVHTLMGCAEAVQQNNLAVVDEMVKEIRMLASSLGGAMGKVATYFAEALARRIYGFPTQDNMYMKNDSLSDLLQIHFYETCPYLKFAHFTANQAILEALDGHKRVHVIDFNLRQGVQWPALIQALALRPGGPPAFRLTGIGPPPPDGNDVLHEVGLKLAQLAKSIHVDFDFQGYLASNLSDVKLWMLDIRPGEAVAVNSVFQLHRLLYSADAATPSPIDQVLSSVKRLNPRIVTIVEQEANHNSPVFLERFTESLHYYSTMFDSLEACILPPQSPEQVLSEMYLGREICDIVACEGPERVERHQTLMQWRLLMHGAGFRPLHLGSNAFKQASMLLSLFSGGDGYRVEENNGCLTLGWHSRPLIAASAWQCS